MSIGGGLETFFILPDFIPVVSILDVVITPFQEASPFVRASAVMAKLGDGLGMATVPAQHLRGGRLKCGA